MFGAIGWSLIAILSGNDAPTRPQYEVMDAIPDWILEIALIGGAVTQLIGLKRDCAEARAAGAWIISVTFLWIFASIAVKAPDSRGLAMYLACISIEVCATIYQIAVVVRYKGITPCQQRKLKL